MRVCDVVLNSIWCDPRVRKQIVEYQNNDIEVMCVGMKCPRYDAEKVANMPCSVHLSEIPENLKGKLNSPLKKLKREKIVQDAVTKAIIDTKPDVIHANDLNALIPAYRAAKKLKCVLIYDSHEVYIENHTRAPQKLYRAYLKMQEQYIVKRIDKMISVSHAAADYFAKFYKIETPMVVTNCSIKAEKFISEEKNPGFEVLNHGQFYEGRGYDIMAEAIPLLKEYPEIKLAIRGYGRLEEQLRKRVSELEGDNFIFYPPVLVQELIPYASRSMVGVAVTENTCLNFNLSVSNKLFEYASAGLPVIMSDIPEHRYLNEKYNFGIIIPDDKPETFANAVIKLYTDKELYSKCAENARRLSDEVNWENEFGKLIEFERNAIAEK